MILTARQAAVRVMQKCLAGGNWVGSVLEETVSRQAFDDPRDKALTYRICLGVIQNVRLIDFYIASYSSKKITEIDDCVLNILRVSVYQILFLDKVPDSAAVNEGVELCGYFRVIKAKGFVNAVLRKIAGNKNSLPEIPGKGTAAYLALRYSYEEELAEYLCSAYGYDFAEDFFRCSNTEPETDLQINTIKISTDDYRKLLDGSGIAFKEYAFPDNCVSVTHGSVTELPGFDEGFFYVQDRAAAVPALISGITPGSLVLDCCAAPGGKTFSAAIRTKNSGKIVSCDLHGKKLKLIESGAKRLGIDIVETHEMSASVDVPEYRGRFDAVIADVPCSGFGVIRKKPEIRFKKFKETAGLPGIQADILANVSSYVRPGGTLVYSTCTILREENERVVESFLDKHPEYSLAPFTVGDLVCDKGYYTFMPNIDGTDGFFAAKLKRDN